MKHLMMTVVTVLTLGVTMTMVKADTYQSGVMRYYARKRTGLELF